MLERGRGRRVVAPAKLLEHIVHRRMGHSIDVADARLSWRCPRQKEQPSGRAVQVGDEDVSAGFRYVLAHLEARDCASG